MIAHKQTIFGDGKDGSTPGNCFQVAIASLLELPVDVVPHFAAMDDFQGGALAFLRDRGKTVSIYRERWKGSPTVFSDATIAPLNYAPNNQMMLAMGQAPRGFYHVVLWKAGHLVHDPHPDGSGLIGEPDEYWSIKDAAAAISSLPQQGRIPERT